jgi:hypothetical protein
MSIRNILLVTSSAAIVAACNSVPFPAAQRETPQAKNPVEIATDNLVFDIYRETIRRQVAGGITSISVAEGGVVVTVAPDWEPQEATGHDAEEHWWLAAIGQDWVRFERHGQPNGFIYSHINNVVIQRHPGHGK